jgi:cell volume regulation protein A
MSFRTLRGVHELSVFGTVVLIASGGFIVALLAHKLSAWLRVPAPAVFLLAAAAASDAWSRLDILSIRAVERVGVVALIVILFDGGMQVGVRRFRSSALPILSLGFLGTFATAGVLAGAAHWLLGFSWTTSGLLGAALAPTDPAVMFSVLGNREVGGRTGTILEAESGVNDPVGISLMVGLLALARHPGHSFWSVVSEFAVQMSIGTAAGICGGLLLVRALRQITLPGTALYPLWAFAAAGVVYGAAAVLHGSGFLAVFIAGVVLGDERVPFKRSIERFHTSLASLAEIAVFAALGLTVHLGDLGSGRLWADAAVLAAVLAFVARPAVVGPLLVPARLRWGERVFVTWGGLKGAVPILLGTLVLLDGVAPGRRIYDIIFLVVAGSVLVQGSSLPWAAGRLGVPMRELEARPYGISIGLDREPSNVARFVVQPASRAAGVAIGKLPISERTWVSLIVRQGAPTKAHGSTVLEPGDELVVLAEREDEEHLRHLFESRKQD